MVHTTVHILQAVIHIQEVLLTDLPDLLIHIIQAEAVTGAAATAQAAAAVQAAAMLSAGSFFFRL